MTPHDVVSVVYNRYRAQVFNFRAPRRLSLTMRILPLVTGRKTLRHQCAASHLTALAPSSVSSRVSRKVLFMVELWWSYGGVMANIHTSSLELNSFNRSQDAEKQINSIDRRQITEQMWSMYEYGVHRTVHVFPSYFLCSLPITGAR
jgi:hypothetical protein